MQTGTLNTQHKTPTKPANAPSEYYNWNAWSKVTGWNVLSTEPDK